MMAKSCQITASFLLMGLLVSAAGQGCHYENCLCGETYFLCTTEGIGPGQDAHLSPLPINLNVVTKLPGGILPPNLTQIYFTNSPIVDISNNAFDGSTTTLQTLSLTNTSLTRIPDAFINLTVLTSFSISGAKIQDWNEAFLRNIANSLTSLSLINVETLNWPSWIKNCSHLKDLTFSSSSVSSIPDDAFDQISESLTTLVLSNNKLVVTPVSFTELINLKILSMDGNKLTNITWLPQSSVLYSLSLNNNHLSDSTHVSNAVRPFAEILNTLDLSYNQFTSILNLDFMMIIEFIDLSFNHLSDPYSGSLPLSVLDLNLGYNFLPYIPHVLSGKSVNSLTLISNSITEIREGDISSFITNVDLQNNLITQLTETSFPQNSSISTLSLNNNPLKTISLSAFKNLLNLKYLSLRNTHLTRMPLALASLTNISSFDISDNRYLVCTCEEKSLRKWVAPLPAWTFQGDCGHTSVYFFFTALSPGCP